MNGSVAQRSSTRTSFIRGSGRGHPRRMVLDEQPAPVAVAEHHREAGGRGERPAVAQLREAVAAAVDRGVAVDADALLAEIDAVRGLLRRVLEVLGDFRRPL